jgi:hypothetical protein
MFAYSIIKVYGFYVLIVHGKCRGFYETYAAALDAYDRLKA